LQEHNFDNVIKVNVENAIQGIIDALEEKSQDIKSAKKINPEAINQITNYCEEIKIVKQKIESDIKILESKKLDENEIVDNIKNNYIDLIILQFNNEEKGNLAKYKNTLQKIEEINGDSEKGIKFLNQRLSQEIKKIKIESKTIEKYLLKLGLDHFTIDISDSDFENITISYNNTEKNKIRNSLSEGEKTALAFSYFLSKYENEVNSIEEQKKSVVIIDDPISSLDENRLYSTAILIKDFFKNTRQLIVMSHNFLFLKFFNANVKNPNTLFLDDNSLVSLPEELQNFETPYYYMLKKIIDFAENENADYNQVKLYLPNFIRRVLETFLSFKFSRISQKNKKDSSRSPGLKEYREDIDLTTYDDKTKELLKYNLDIIIKITDTHSHGNAHNQQDGFYISEKDLKILANSSLQIIDEMDKLHFSSYKQKEIN
jgi:wobble nucleotide-excising tRNase